MMEKIPTICLVATSLSNSSGLMLPLIMAASRRLVLASCAKYAIAGALS
jgi:hypothetical protein